MIKQGCNLSCLLFALYLNDLENVMYFKTCKGVPIVDPNTGLEMIKMLVLLYADDTTIFSNKKIIFA